LVFKDGRIVEAGTFEALRRKDGAFEALVKAGQLEPPKKPHVVTA
jgi:ABC-type multidrug transport system fused ATPase/permease subunit